MFVYLGQTLTLLIGCLEGRHLEYAHAKCINVHSCTILALEYLGGHELWCANESLGVGIPSEDGQPQISYSNLVGIGVDEYVLAFYVSVDDGRRFLRVEVVKPLQDLSTPALDDFQPGLLYFT